MPVGRREFLAAAPAWMAQSNPLFLKSICSGVFPPDTPLEERFRLARNAGFEGIEIRLDAMFPPSATKQQAAQIADAANRRQMSIVSLWVSSALEVSWLNHPDPAIRAKGVTIVHQAIDLARQVDCGAVLIVPGRLGNGATFLYGYQDSWDRITAEFRKLIPHAAGARVCLTPENVWNKFLLSPVEMKTFVDQFQSPWLQAHFDIGNVMQFGYPQDWIRTLGSRIKRVHVKDYKLSTRAERGRFVDLLEGDVDWKEVMAALKAAGYRGYLSPEYGPNPAQPDRLLRVSKALDTILAFA